ncbi:MAG: hypothetical protein PUD27_02050 [Solobacterium sp.]|nr:hypothetical protein [Solobacterium sp.]MDY2731824.1 hypothetical protein [Erysipelotrichaceae bacterium]MDD5983682.1 hypothetical protein [Solobacterium sp.]MDD6835257.1 hypothetical protein [Solobacterium sp.]MDD6885443.1 hypothetical protein [Solobacterium sp.]
MIKDVLKKQELTAYLSLKHDLESGKLAHSYLFYGELNPLKTEAAFLMAQSIIEGSGTFACEECEQCKRIRQLKHLDVIYINGYKASIKVNDIEQLMMEFSKTAAEQSGRKVYIIDNINNSSQKVLNMILKFMEEPGSRSTYGIFLSDNIDGLLPTVVSRCRRVEFKTRDFSYLIAEYEKHGFENTDAYLLSRIKHCYEDMDLNDECYTNAREYVYKTIGNLDNRDYLPAMFFNEFYTCVNKDDFKLLSDYYLSIMQIVISDALIFNTRDDNEYNNCLNILRNRDLVKLMEIFMDASKKAKTNINRQLLFDQIGAHLISL